MGIKYECGCEYGLRMFIANSRDNAYFGIHLMGEPYLDVSSSAINICEGHRKPLIESVKKSVEDRNENRIEELNKALNRGYGRV